MRLKKIFFLSTLIWILLPKTSVSQNLTIMCNGITDTIKACKGANLTFECSNVNDRQLKFNFEDGSLTDFQLKTSLSHTFTNSGAYIVKAIAIDNNGNTESDNIIVEIGTPPLFNNYTTSIDKSQTGICMGESATLTMQIENRTITYIAQDYVEEQTPQPIYNSSWTGTIDLKNYENLTINNADDIEYISTNLEYDNIKDLNISVKCPNGKFIILKDYGGNNYQLGITADIAVGTTYNYIFKEIGTTINETILEDDNTIIPEGEYKSQESFSALEGCPIDGEWQITITSNSNNSDGYVSNCKLKLKDEIIETNQWNFKQIYNISHAVWSGKGVGATSNGITKVTPPEYDINRYDFVVSDNFSCPHDTFVIINVEKPQITWQESSENYIGDEIEFSCQASWASEYIWNFGDKTQFANTNPAPHAYYEKGNYQIIVQATSKSGCADRDTQNINIIPRPLEVEEVNIFSPNDDGLNDIFSFFKKDESYLSNGGLTLMPANIRTFRGKIYNIFGQTVCKWENIEEAVAGWDGTLNNNGNRHCPPGTYFYDIIVTGKDGNSLKRSGTIMLYKPKN